MIDSHLMKPFPNMPKYSSLTMTNVLYFQHNITIMNAGEGGNW